MEWIKISTSPDNNKDTLLWRGNSRQDMMLRAFYCYLKTGEKGWMDMQGKKIPDEELNKYTHWLKIEPPKEYVKNNLIESNRNETKTAEEFVKEHFKGIEKETWYPAIVSIAEGYGKYLLEQQNK